MARGKYKGPKRGAGQRARSGGASEETEMAERDARIAQQQRKDAGEASSSEDESGDEAPAAAGKGGKPLNMFGQIGQPGDLPPNSDSDESGSESDSSSDDSDIQPLGALPPKKSAAPPVAARRKKAEDDVDAAQIAKDMERLAMIKSKREEERQDRIKKEGWDRFAPVTKDNHAPGVDPNAAAA